MIDVKPRPDQWLPEGHVAHDYVGFLGPCLHEYNDGVCGRPNYWAGHTPICTWRREDGFYGCGHLAGHVGPHSSMTPVS